MKTDEISLELFVSLLLLHHHHDNPIPDVFIQDDILILRIQRVEDLDIVELLTPLLLL